MRGAGKKGPWVAERCRTDSRMFCFGVLRFEANTSGRARAKGRVFLFFSFLAFRLPPKPGNPVMSATESTRHFPQDI
ncbi:hypothetical protein CGRA01v4_01516 [Colletotrichum graminicola]|nr:hypothetical protein CGRA01v4_01516 [Colletotrichum graminicola]